MITTTMAIHIPINMGDLVLNFFTGVAGSGILKKFQFVYILSNELVQYMLFPMRSTRLNGIGIGFKPTLRISSKNVHFM